MVIRGKRGWLRIVEAIIGITIITGILLAAYARNVETRDISEQVYELQNLVLGDVVDEYRNDIVSDGDGVEGAINDSIVGRDYFPANFDFEIRVCNIGEVCNFRGDFFGGNIYAEERIVSADLENYSPKKLRLFVWEK